MKRLTSAQLFAPPKTARKTKARIARAKLVIVAARERAAATYTPRHDPSYCVIDSGNRTRFLCQRYPQDCRHDSRMGGWPAEKRTTASGNTRVRGLQERCRRACQGRRATARREKIRRRTIGRLNRRPRHSSGVVAGSAGASERRTGLPVTFRQLPEGKVRASGDASTLDRGGIPAYPSSPR